MYGSNSRVYERIMSWSEVVLEKQLCIYKHIPWYFAFVTLYSDIFNDILFNIIR